MSLILLASIVNPRFQSTHTELIYADITDAVAHSNKMKVMIEFLAAGLKFRLTIISEKNEVIFILAFGKPIVAQDIVSNGTAGGVVKTFFCSRSNISSDKTLYSEII